MLDHIDMQTGLDKIRSDLNRNIDAIVDRACEKLEAIKPKKLDESKMLGYEEPSEELKIARQQAAISDWNLRALQSCNSNPYNGGVLYGQLGQYLNTTNPSSLRTFLICGDAE